MSLEEEIFASLEHMPHNFSNATVSMVLDRINGLKESKSSKSKKRRWVAPIGAGIVAVAVCGVVIEQVMPLHHKTTVSESVVTQLNTQVLSHVAASDIAQSNSVLKKAGFAIEQPTSFPFIVIHTMAELRPLNHNHTVVQITYLGSNRQVLLFSATNAKASRSDTTQKVTLNSGDIAYFSASQANSEISWESHGIYYRLQSLNQGQTGLSKQQLVDIANSSK